MPSTIRIVLRICLLTTIATVMGAAANAQQPSTLATHDLSTWLEQFPMLGSQLQETTVARTFWTDEELRSFSGQSIVGLGIKGRVQFASKQGLVRIIMLDNQLHEYLVYETYSLIAPSDSFEIHNACRETCLLSPIVPSILKVELVDASVDIQSIVTNHVTPTINIRRESAAQTLQQIQDVKAAQETEIVDELNRQIKAKGLKWIAGETPISRLSYSEKKALLSCLAIHPDTPPNLQGAEYYIGGILDARTAQTTALVFQQGSALIDSFDWRSRHGANRPGSAYYDGDASGGGWMTSIKSQRCNDCWAHSALGATEALANLYFNQHLDLNLSEQELVSCSGAGSCRYGGNTGAALSYVQSIGVVDEACFPESGLDESCGNCCRTPRERVMVAGFEDIYPSMGEDNIKRRLITSGPLPFGISSWWHALVLTGSTTEIGTGDTVWILKNSWGTGWGDHGYGYVKVSLSDIYLTYSLRNPVVSLITPYTVACRDADEDGYFNWGISSGAAVACGSVPAIEDCDDSDPTVALLTEDGACTAAPTLDTTAPAITMAVTPSTVWPPNGKFVPVIASGTITDAESGVNVNTAAYSVADEYGRVQPTGHVAVDVDGSYTFTLLLEASREGDDRDGRQYKIVVTAEDEAGNSGSTSNVALVPHDMR